MAPRPRGRPKEYGTRMDAALDAMRPFGFDEQLVRETVHGLLDVYEGNQGWPFIEEASYKLLIDTILSNQPSSVEEKEDSLQDPSSAATPTTRITRACFSKLVTQDSLLQASKGLGSASQTNDQDSASLGNPKTDVKDSTMVAEREGGQIKRQGIRVESNKEVKPADNATRNNDSKILRPHGIQSSQPIKKLPFGRSKPCYGWISSDEDEDEDGDGDIEKLLGRRRKSRWDEKPDDT